MYKRHGIHLLALAAVIVLSTQCLAGTRSIASTDRVTPGDWTYDAMMSLAADGLVPGMAARVFQGDRRFNRMEMAAAVASVVQESEVLALDSKQRSLLRRLVAEFGPELTAMDADAAGWTADDGHSVGSGLYLLGYARDLISDTPDDSTSSLSYRASGFLDLSRSVFGIVTAAEKEEKAFHVLRGSTNLDKAFIVSESGGFSWLVGRAYLNWGPCYSGSLIMSDNAPAFWQIRAGREINLGKLIGRVKITQFASTFEDVGQTLYLFGRRYEKPLSDRWHLGLSETAKLNTTPNPLMLAMPFYLYQHLFLEEDGEINNLIGVDLTYRTPRGAAVYGELMVDDMTAPRLISDDFDRPRKAGYTLGLSVPMPLGGERYSSFTAEYTVVDRLTYGATRDDVPELAYLHDWDVIGHPIGANSKAIYLRGEYSLSRRVSLIGEYLNQRQKDPGPPERGSRRFVSLTAAYDIAPDRSVSLRVAPYEIVSPRLTDDGTEYQLRASFGF